MPYKVTATLKLLNTTLKTIRCGGLLSRCVKRATEKGTMGVKVGVKATKPLAEARGSEAC